MSDGNGSKRSILGDEDLRVLEDGTLGGYLESHSRPPAFEGADGHPYTVSVEWERVGSLQAPYAGFLVFPRWALSGVGVLGHLETPILWQAESVEAVRHRAGSLTLREVRNLLNQAIAARSEGGGPTPETP